MFYLQLQLLFITFALFLSGCNIFSKEDSSYYSVQNSQSGTSVSPTNESKYFAILGPISNGKVTLYDVANAKVIYTTQTQSIGSETQLKWGDYKVGSFVVDIDKDLPKSSWVELVVTSGEDIDSDDNGVVGNGVELQGKMKLFCKAEDFEDNYVVANIFTTLAVENYLADKNQTTLDIQSYLDKFAQSVFVKSVDKNPGVDYRDLFAYIPNHTTNLYFKNVKIYENLLKYDVMKAVLENKNLITLLKEDKDSDTLTLWEEILHGTSPQLADSDGDGISDADEITQGLSPILKDSDYDGIDDYNETTYGTSALNPDSDDDYIPDGIEVKNGTDPLNGDEDGDSVKDGLEGDPFFKYQWYIKSNGDVVANTANVATVVSHDIGVLDVYHSILGNHDGHETVIQVVDTGVELKHEDLDVYLADSFNAVTKAQDPTSTNEVSKSDPKSPLNVGHGTAVAGIMAAKTNNGLGVRGIVPRAKIAGSNWLEEQTLGELERVWYSGITDDNITACNNSWGTYYLKDESFERILALGVEQLRHGRGRVYVFAAGNSRSAYGNANLSYLTNNPYSIAVAALNSQDKYTSYSNPGSSILVSGYGGEHYYTAPTIMTTSLSGESYYENELGDRVGVITVNEDANKSYTYAMNGTSSAAPTVTASISLTLDACPTLTWRDIRWIIAHSATKIDSDNKEWVTNGAGLDFNINYGYGKINPLEMIRICRSQYFELLPAMVKEKVTYTYDDTIPDNNTTITKKLSFGKDIKIEWVGLTLDTDHPYCGDLEVNIISPSGTKINLISPNQLSSAAYEGGFRFSTVGLIDENAAGEWQVEITDRLSDDDGKLKSLVLEVHGYEK